MTHHSTTTFRDRSWVQLWIVTFAVAVLYAPVFPPMIREWLEFPNLSHGFAVPLVSAYIIWSRRARLRTLPLEPSYWGVPLLLLGLVALTLGIRGGESFLARWSLPFTLWGVALLLGGTALFKHVWYGIGYLVFMIPLPYATLKLVTYRSRIFDATASAHMLGWLGIPILQDGVLLHLPNITLEVADECSSIPALAAMIALGAAYACMTQSRASQRAALILMSVPLAISSNIIRIVATAWGAYYIGPIVLQNTLHKFSGTTNFLLTFFLLILLDRGLTTLFRSNHR